MNKISVVMPTFNRGQSLSNIIEAILKSNVDDFSTVEIIVVDDGSTLPAETFLREMKINPPFTLKIIRQQNAGPAAARNNGMRNATNEIILFIDDDILVTPELLIKHAVGHEFFSNSIIYGFCPYVIPEKKSPAYRFLAKIIEPKSRHTSGKDDYLQTDGIASGNISIEKSSFPDGEFYKTSLRSPVAEEYELIARLLQKKIKAYFNTSIIGWHLQPTNIESKCQQEIKYGIGIAEVSLKVPYSSEYTQLKKLFDENREKLATDSNSVRIKKGIKQLVSGKKGLAFLLKVTKITEKILPFDSILFPMYRILCGCNLFAGVRQGVKQFKREINT